MSNDKCRKLNKDQDDPVFEMDSDMICADGGDYKVCRKHFQSQ